MNKPFNEADPILGTELKMNDLIMHGDVFLTKVEKLPENFEALTKSKDSCLAYGEATNHHHKLFRFGEDTGSAAFDLRIADDGKRYLKVLEPTILKHQEHRPIEIPPGYYDVGIQREYDPFLKIARQVVD